ncbi:triphosphoribosyl-dephospho-CoA synthetase [Bradyrhizobium diazoefficiens]
MTLIADVTDTNLLHRGGAEGLRYAQDSASAFLAAGGVGRHGWRERAIEIHQAFVARNLSPGGSADLLAMALFVDRLDP